MDEITPVFVCGMPRSGTTNALQVLNTHPSVMLNSEIPLSILKHFFALLDTTENSYSEPERKQVWRENKAQYMFDSFGYLAKGGRGRLEKAQGAKFRGHKSPRLETLFERYESHFGEIGPAPFYFYCARNPFDCWRSHRSMSWSTYETAQEFLRHYKTSFVKLQQMRETAGARVFVLNLDDLKGASDALTFYRENIFAPLGLDLPERTEKRIMKVMDKRESSAAPVLEKDEKDAIAREPGVAELLETYFPKSMSASR
jgi:Sulfotransferase family